MNFIGLPRCCYEKVCSEKRKIYNRRDETKNIDFFKLKENRSVEQLELPLHDASLYVSKAL
jgi:hypothetical protein